MNRHRKALLRAARRWRHSVRLAAVLAVAAGGAQAQSVACAPRDKLVEQLASQFGESRQAVGLGGDSQMLEVFASLETGTWTIIVTSPAGVSCIKAAGQAFQLLAEPLPEQGDPT